MRERCTLEMQKAVGEIRILILALVTVLSRVHTRNACVDGYVQERTWLLRLAMFCVGVVSPLVAVLAFPSVLLRTGVRWTALHTGRPSEGVNAVMMITAVLGGPRSLRPLSPSERS